MPVFGPSLESNHAEDLIEVLSNKNIPDDRVIWKNGEKLIEQLDRTSALQLSRRLSQGYLDAKLIERNRPGKDVFIVYSENQVIGFPNLISIVVAGGIVATCPWQATTHELLYRVNAVRPKAIICSEKSLPVALDAKSQATMPFEIIVQDTSRWTVYNQATGHSYISDRQYLWKNVSSDFEKDRASVLVFSSGTTGSPKGITQSYFLYLGHEALIAH
jgi:acyl-coenzyme A synthetase/AMP-(fatty) acid ligase